MCVALEPHGLIADFLLKELTALTIVRSGTTSLVDLTSAWSAPQQLDTHFWVTREPNFDLGTLSSGESVSVRRSLIDERLASAFGSIRQTFDASSESTHHTRREGLESEVQSAGHHVIELHG